MKPRFAALVDAMSIAMRHRLEGTTFIRRADQTPEDSELADLVEAALEGAAEFTLALDGMAPSLPLAPRTPPEIPGVRLVREIGRGGMGVVYEGEQESPRRRVVVKFLYRGHGAAHEAQMMADALQHAPDGICQVYGMGEIDGRPYLITQYIEGTSLATFLQNRETAVTSNGDTTRGSFFFGADSPQPTITPSEPTLETGARRREVVGPLPRGEAVVEAARLIERAARGLHWVHEAGVIHGDLKPANIMVTPDGRPVVIDFGVASPAKERISYGGTPIYMPPEQRKGLDIDRRVDVFALGLILYRMLAVRRPEGPLRVSGPNPSPLHEVNRHVSRDLSAVCHKAFALDPDERYATALEFADDLARAVAHRPTQALPCGPVRRVALLVRRYPQAAAAVLVAILAGGGFGWQAWREKEAVVEERRDTRARVGRALTAFDRFLQARAEGREPAPEDDSIVREQTDPTTYNLIRQDPDSPRAVREAWRVIKKLLERTRSGSSSWCYPNGEDLRVGGRFTFRIAGLPADRVPDAPLEISLGVYTENYEDIVMRFSFKAEPVIEDGVAIVRLPDEIDPAPAKGERLYVWRVGVPTDHGSEWKSGDRHLLCVAPGFLDEQVAKKAPRLTALPEPLHSVLRARVLLELRAPEAALETLDGLDDTALSPSLRGFADRIRLRALADVDPPRAKALLEKVSDDR